MKRFFFTKNWMSIDCPFSYHTIVVLSRRCYVYLLSFSLTAEKILKSALFFAFDMFLSFWVIKKIQHLNTLFQFERENVVKATKLIIEFYHSFQSLAIYTVVSISHSFYLPFFFCESFFFYVIWCRRGMLRNICWKSAFYVEHLCLSVCFVLVFVIVAGARLVFLILYSSCTKLLWFIYGFCGLTKYLHFLHALFLLFC